MPIWGKILGAIFGLMLSGNIFGAILGVIIGHMFDRGYSQDFNQMGGFSRFFTSQDELKSQAIFFHSLFSIMGHMAKADGQVTATEIKVATRLMDDMGLEGDTRSEAQQAFREGKEKDFALQATVKEFAESCHGRRDILQVFLEILIQSAYADGEIHAAEQRVLETVAQTLGFRQHQLLYLMSMFEAETRFRQHNERQRRGQRHTAGNQTDTSMSDAYKILGVSKSDDDRTIKKAYRKLMAEHHPDKLVSKGLPKQAMEIARAKAQDIQAAYEAVKHARGMK